MQSKELSIQVKQTIVRLQKQNKSITEITGTLGVATSTVSYILRKKECTTELSNIKRHGRPRRTTVVDDRWILSMVKKNPFSTSSQEKNTLQEVDVSLSKSTIKRRLHQSKYRGYTTRCKQGQIRLCQKASKKSQTTSGKAFFGRLKLRSTCTRMMGRKKYGEGWEQGWHKHAWLPVALGCWCLLMTWQKTEAAGRILKCIVIYSLPRFSQMEQSWLGGAS